MNIQAILRDCAFFKELSDDELSLMTLLCHEEQHEAGSTVFSEGQPADALYVLAEGKVALEIKIQLAMGRSGRRATTEIVSPGEVFGWSALVDPYMYTMTGVCLQPIKVVVIPAAELRQILSSCPMGLAVMKQLVGTIAGRLKNTRYILLHAMAILSHDLKAPLAAIESYNQVMLGGFAGPINDDQKEILERNSARIKELLTLISDLLDISRIEAGSLEREFERMSLAQVGREGLATAQALGAAKGVTAKDEIAADLPDLVGASSRLRQVVTNLLSNAIKFTPAGGTVILRMSDQDGYLQTEIIDTGIGISPDDLPHIFDDFYTGKDVEAKGQGLGLSIAKKIVKAHQGRIWAESPWPPEGQAGTRMVFTIPKNLSPLAAQ